MKVTDKTDKELLTARSYYVECLEEGVRSKFERVCMEMQLTTVTAELESRGIIFLDIAS